jgi:hypothetical protein
MMPDDGYIPKGQNTHGSMLSELFVIINDQSNSKYLRSKRKSDFKSWAKEVNCRLRNWIVPPLPPVHLLWSFSRWGLMNYLPGLISNLHPILASQKTKNKKKKWKYTELDLQRTDISHFVSLRTAQRNGTIPSFTRISFFFPPCSIGVWIWGLTLARQALYHLRHAASPFCFKYFSNRVLLLWLYYPQQQSCLYFPCYCEDRCLPHAAFIGWDGLLRTFAWADLKTMIL